MSRKFYRAAVDEAGHAIQARLMGFSMKLVSINPEEQPNHDSRAGKIAAGGYTVPDFQGGGTLVDTVKYMVAGVAAMKALGIDEAGDEDGQPDILDAIAHIKSERHRMPKPPDDRKVSAFVRQMLVEVTAELSKPENKAAVTRCADYLIEHKTISGDDIGERLDSFLKPQQVHDDSPESPG